MFTEGLDSFDYSVEKSLANYAAISVDQAKELTKNIPLGDYMDLVNALDQDDEPEITRIIDDFLMNSPYDDVSDVGMAESFTYFKEGYSLSDLVISEQNFFKFIKRARVKDVAESRILGNLPVLETQSHLVMLPSMLQEAYAKFDKASAEEITETISMFRVVTESIGVMRDLFAMRKVFEELSHLEKQKLANTVHKPLNQINNPRFNDPKNGASDIVSVDPRSGAIATQDEKGDITIQSLNDNKVKSQITTEEIDRLKKLSGI